MADGLSVFLKTFELFVAIFCLSGSFVAQALAGPGPVRYELGAGAAQLFVINNATGNITIQSHIDREVCSEDVVAYITLRLRLTLF